LNVTLLRSLAVNFVADRDSIYNIKVTIAASQFESTGIPHGKDQVQVCALMLYVVVVL